MVTSSSNGSISGGGGMLPSAYYERVALKHGGNSKRASRESEPPYLSRKKSKTTGNHSSNSKGKEKDMEKETVKSSNANAYTRGMFLAFVDNALAERRLGRSEHYNDLIVQFRTLASGLAGSSSTTTGFGTGSTSSSPSSTSTLRSWLEALTHSVVQLDRTHFVLVDAIISLPWTIITLLEI
ncbi:MAG: hypothetical protein CYPHOPRED_002523 [Cyphobasidiales sp. Tagirdzhanova-0007]|nr:MAG: hypothetical protein CYPHOPRED_002523 [Cyphobasidiales sp. Tagirdzhanova-0007]